MTINLNQHRKNIFQNHGLRECPHYGEDGVLLEIFERIDPGKTPLCIEFGESRVLGTTTRAFRIRHAPQAIYFTGDYNLRSFILNCIDIFKVSFVEKNLKYLKFFLNMPFKFFVTEENIIQILNKKISKSTRINILTVDIDSYDYYLIRKLLANKFMPDIFIVEYNPSFGLDLKVTYPNKLTTNFKNKRMYGASYQLLQELFNQYDYKLCFVSGFCNLFFVHNKYAHQFSAVNIEDEITDTDEKIINYIQKYCQNGFIPSWFQDPKLDGSDIKQLDQF